MGEGGGLIFQIESRTTHCKYSEAYQIAIRRNISLNDFVITNHFDLYGYTYWRLPSADEFLKMIEVQELDIDIVLGGKSGPYWTSEFANYKDHRCPGKALSPMFLVYWIGLKTTYYPNGKPFKNTNNWIPKCPNDKYFVRPVWTYTKQN